MRDYYQAYFKTLKKYSASPDLFSISINLVSIGLQKCFNEFQPAKRLQFGYTKYSLSPTIYPYFRG